MVGKYFSIKNVWRKKLFFSSIKSNKCVTNRCFFWYSIKITSATNSDFMSQLSTWQFLFYFVYIQGTARTQSPTTKNCTPELITFGLIARVSPSLVQWKGLALEEPPWWSWLPLSQVSMLQYHFSHLFIVFIKQNNIGKGYLIVWLGSKSSQTNCSIKYKHGLGENLVNKAQYWLNWTWRLDILFEETNCTIV